MRTGVDLIAENRAMIDLDTIVAECKKSGKTPEWIDSAISNMSFLREQSVDRRIRSLAHAGALIAAEIDRLNNVKQE